jgi:hypothetical protein
MELGKNLEKLIRAQLSGIVTPPIVACNLSLDLIEYPEIAQRSDRTLMFHCGAFGSRQTDACGRRQNKYARITLSWPTGGRNDSIVD